MARKSVKMRTTKKSSTSTKTEPTDSSVPFSTGLFGHLHTGSIVSCKAEDTSFFCTLSKVFSGLIMIIGILVILYLIYYFAKLFLFSKKK
jgi:hypothetical protein